MISTIEFNTLITNTLGIETVTAVVAMTLAFSPQVEDITKQTQDFIKNELTSEEITHYKTSLRSTLGDDFMADLRRQLDEGFEKMEADTELSNVIRNDPEFIKSDVLIKKLNTATPSGIGRLTTTLDVDEFNIAVLSFIVDADFRAAVESINAWAASMDPEKKAQRQLREKEKELERAFREGEQKKILSLVNKNTYQASEKINLKSRLLDAAIEANDGAIIDAFFELFPQFISHDEKNKWTNAIQSCLEAKKINLLPALIKNRGNEEKLHTLLHSLLTNYYYSEEKESGLAAITTLLSYTPNFDLFQYENSSRSYQLNKIIEDGNTLLLKTLLFHDNILSQLAENDSYPMRAAVRSYNIDAVNILESFGADLNIPSSLSTKYTLLGSLIATSDDESNPARIAMINFLLERNLKLAVNHDRMTENFLAKTYAANKDNFTRFDAYAFFKLDLSQDIALINAIKSSDTAAIKTLLTNNPDLMESVFSRASPSPIETAISFATLDVFNAIGDDLLATAFLGDSWKILFKRLILRGEINLVDLFVKLLFEKSAVGTVIIELDPKIISHLIKNNKISFLKDLLQRYPESIKLIEDNPEAEGSIIGALIPAKSPELIKLFIKQGAKNHITHQGIPLLFHVAGTFSSNFFQSADEKRLTAFNLKDNEGRSILAYVIELKENYSQSDLTFIDFLVDTYNLTISDDYYDIEFILRVASHYMQNASADVSLVVDKFNLLEFIKNSLYGASVNSKADLVVTIFNHYEHPILNYCLTRLIQKHSNTTYSVLKAAKQANVGESVLLPLIYSALSSNNSDIYGTLFTHGYNVNEPLSSFQHSFILPLDYKELTYLGAFILHQDTFTLDKMRFIEYVSYNGGTVTVANTPDSLSQSIIQKLGSAVNMSEKKASNILRIEVFE